MSMLDEFDYQMPEDLIAHAPTEPRDSARLLVYRVAEDVVEYRTVADLPQLLAGTHMVFNDTRVLPARVQATLADGRPIELLLLVDQGVGKEGEVRSLVNTRVRVGQKILTSHGEFVVVEDHEKSMLLRFLAGVAALLELLDTQGETPLPPYIHSHADEMQKRQQYQSMFADRAPSVAAPTASLHFTPELMSRLQARGVTYSSVTLQVGLGTFAPIFEEHFTEERLHAEQYYISDQSAGAIAEARAAGRPVVAVGTTVVRTLESANEALARPAGGAGTTDIFIYPPYHFTYPDMLMTNFHVPRSSLLCLVQAFLVHKGAKRHLIELYKLAIRERFRFYSYGDAMLIL